MLHSLQNRVYICNTNGDESCIYKFNMVHDWDFNVSCRTAQLHDGAKMYMLLCVVVYLLICDCVRDQTLQICTDMTNVLTSLEAHSGRGPDVSLFPIVVGR